MEYWNSLLTEKSWKILQEIRKKYNFVLIGGWAAYMWAKKQKSKDIDIVVDISELQKLKSENLAKNDNLKKYEIKSDDLDIDIYVAHFSKLAIPPEDIENYSVKIEGFNVVSKEALLILKQGAEIDRRNSVKGEKDRLDIISLLFSGINFREYASILKKYSLTSYIQNLLDLVRAFQDYNSLAISPREFKLKKKSLIRQLRAV